MFFLYSPTGASLRSQFQIKDYLLSSGTCKCGLPCPLRPDYFFDFNIQVSLPIYCTKFYYKSLLNHNMTFFLKWRKRNWFPWFVYEASLGFLKKKPNYRDCDKDVSENIYNLNVFNIFRKIIDYKSISQIENWKWKTLS